MQKIIVKINKGVPEIEKITGGDMSPLEFIANMVSATLLHLDLATDMLPEEVFFQMNRHGTKIVDVLNDDLNIDEEDDEEYEEEDDEIAQAMNAIINKHKEGENNAPEDPQLN